SGANLYVLTFGRSFDRVDATTTLEIITRYSGRYDLGGKQSRVELCNSLQDASREPYFFEALFRLSQQPIPFGPTYSAWQRRIGAQMKKGEHLHYLGRRRRGGSRQTVT